MVHCFFVFAVVMAQDVHVCGDPSSLYDPFCPNCNGIFLDGALPIQDASTDDALHDADAAAAHPGTALVAHARDAPPAWDDAVSVANSQSSAAPRELPGMPAGSVTASTAAPPTSGPPYEILKTGAYTGTVYIDSKQTQRHDYTFRGLKNNDSCCFANLLCVIFRDARGASLLFSFFFLGFLFSRFLPDTSSSFSKVALRC